MLRASYAIGLGSNRPHHRHGNPRQILEAALAALQQEGVQIVALSPIMVTPPLGPSRRTFANAAAIVRTPLAPPELLQCLKRLERMFGRRTARRWGERTLDLDIILWSGGRWQSPHLQIPHGAFRVRAFVLDPLVRIAPQWRDPATRLTVRHLLARLKKSKPVDRRAKPD